MPITDPGGTGACQHTLSPHDDSYNMLLVVMLVVVLVAVLVVMGLV
jgi:hypothetical protein